MKHLVLMGQQLWPGKSGSMVFLKERSSSYEL